MIQRKNVLPTGIMREILSCSNGGPEPSRNKWLSIPFSRYCIHGWVQCRATGVMQKCTSKKQMCLREPVQNYWADFFR